MTEDGVVTRPTATSSPGWMLSRQSWGANPPKYHAVLDCPVPYVFATYSGKNPCTTIEWCVFAMRKLQQTHVQTRGCPDIRYNFCIGGDGRVYEGRGWDIKATLPKKYSDFTCTALYIAFMGHFLRQSPGDHMYKALEDLLIEGVRNGFIRKKMLLFRI